MTVAGPGGGVLPRIAMMAVMACALLTNMARADHGPATWSAAAPSVVVIEPTWPGYNRPGFGAPPGTAPAGTGIFIALDLLAAWMGKTYPIPVSVAAINC